jgi:hypothetical protein
VTAQRWNLRWVPSDGNRPAGWWDGEPFRDPVPVAPHLHPRRDEWTIRGLLCVQGVRTLPDECPRCRGVVREWDDGLVACCRPPERGGCGWQERRP